MKGNGNTSPDDCFARFEEAFARLEANSGGADHTHEQRSQPAAAADLSEFEEAFSNIDRQLEAQPLSPVQSSPAAPSTRRPPALVAPSSPAGAASPATHGALHERERLYPLLREITELLRHIHHDLTSHGVPQAVPTRPAEVDQTLEEPAAHAFPPAVREIAEAIRSAECGLHTATVFHLLRATHHGFRGLPRTIGDGTAPVRDWTSAIARIEALIGMEPDAQGTLLNDARLLHDAERRLTSGGVFDQHHALAVLQAGVGFLNRLGPMQATPRP